MEVGRIRSVLVVPPGKTEPGKPIQGMLEVDEIHQLWEEVGNISGKRMPEDRQRPENSGYPPKSRRGFRYRIREAKARLSNKAIRELLGNDAYTEAVLSFLRKTDVGKVKEGVLDRA